VKTRTEVHLWVMQRATAAMLALAVVVHIITIVYAARGGLTAIEIIERLQGNIGWLLFYIIFVLAAAIHAPLGVRTMLTEMTSVRGMTLGVVVVLFGLLIATLGWRAVFILFAYGST
jgi:fumarate reductase subunit C